VELYLVDVESAIRVYLEPAAQEPDLPAEPRERERLGGEFGSLATGARELAATLEDLSAYARDRLGETTRLDRDSLGQLQKLCRLVESQAGAVELEMSGEPDRQRPAVPNAELRLIENLAIVWTRHTDEKILRDHDAQSPWARFVETACGITGIECAYAHQLRVRVFDSAALAESAALLESLPDL
jgi:hypothetical protein